MARIRSIKPEFWTDEKVVALQPLARLLFVGLWNFVDDYGRGEYSPVRIKMQILPADSADIRELLAEISGAGLVTIYTIGGKDYFQVVNFSKHQKIDKRTQSKYPSPPKSPDKSPEITLEGKGKEGKGKEEDAPAAVAAPSADVLPMPLPPDAELYRRGREVLGKAAGGLIKRLLDSKNGSIAQARAAIEQASEKANPREYIGGILKARDDAGAQSKPGFGDDWG